MGRARSHQPTPARVKDTRPTMSLGGITQGSGEASASPLVVNEPLSSTLTTRCVKVALCPGGRKATSSPGCTGAVERLRGHQRTHADRRAHGRRRHGHAGARPRGTSRRPANALTTTDDAEERGEGADARGLDPARAGPPTSPRWRRRRSRLADHPVRDTPKSSPGRQVEAGDAGRGRRGEGERHRELRRRGRGGRGQGRHGRPATRGARSETAPGTSPGRRAGRSSSCRL